VTCGTSHISDLDGWRYRLDRFWDRIHSGGSILVLDVLDGRRRNRITGSGRDFSGSGRVILGRKVSRGDGSREGRPGESSLHRHRAHVKSRRHRT
jgi:hypothetical protein